MNRALALVAALALLVSFGMGQFTDPAPEFRVRSIDGQELTLSKLRGKVVVLNFWFIACAPCRVEIPKLNQMVKEFAGKEVVFIAFAPDTEDELRAFFQETEFDYQLVGKASETARRYRVIGAPTHFVINKEGRIVRERRGALEDPGKELGDVIRGLL